METVGKLLEQKVDGGGEGEEIDHNMNSDVK